MRGIVKEKLLGSVGLCKYVRPVHRGSAKVPVSLAVETVSYQVSTAFSAQRSLTCHVSGTAGFTLSPEAQGTPPSIQRIRVHAAMAQNGPVAENVPKSYVKSTSWKRLYLIQGINEIEPFDGLFQSSELLGLDVDPLTGGRSTFIAAGASTDGLDQLDGHVPVAQHRSLGMAQRVEYLSALDFLVQQLAHQGVEMVADAAPVAFLVGPVIQFPFEQSTQAGPPAGVDEAEQPEFDEFGVHGNQTLAVVCLQALVAVALVEIEHPASDRLAVGAIDLRDIVDIIDVESGDLGTAGPGEQGDQWGPVAVGVVLLVGRFGRVASGIVLGSDGV